MVFVPPHEPRGTRCGRMRAARVKECLHRTPEQKQEYMHIPGSSTYVRFSRVKIKGLQTLEDPGISRKSKSTQFLPISSRESFT